MSVDDFLAEIPPCLRPPREDDVMTTRAYHFDFDNRQRVIIDGDADICGVITAICVEIYRTTYRVEWFHNGALHSGYFDGFRLTLAP